MTGNRLLEGDLPIQPCLLNTTLHYPNFIRVSIGTNASANSGRNMPKLIIPGMRTLTLYLILVLMGQVRLYSRIDLFKDVCLLFSKRRAAITIYTAATLAGIQITDKLGAHHIIGH
jgi:hypothetical protein